MKGTPEQAHEFLTKLATAMFDAYNEQGPNPWKTFDGRDVPHWDELSDQVRDKWRAAARKSVDWLAEFNPAEVVQ